MFLVGILSAFTDLCALFQDSILPSGLWNSNMAFYSSLDLYQLNSKTRSKLPVGIYNHCAALGIARRPRYIHRGSRRKQCTKTTISAVGCTHTCRLFFLFAPRPSGHGGGLATVFRNSFKCRLLSVDASFSFEAQLLKMDLNGPLLCVLVYRPPKVSTTFIHELSEFLSNQVSRCDRLLVLGDFNIHVCCPSKPMVKNFMSLMDSLNFVQSVSSPTHNRGHILDLVLTRDFSVHICEIFDAGISDHYPVVFEPVISYDQPILSLPVHYSRAFHANTALEFCESYSKFLSNSNVPPSSCMDTEQLVEIFNSACCTALNTVAPLKRKKCKISSSPQPWFNASTRTLRQECRRAECRWKKDGLQVSYQILKNCLTVYQNSVKEAKSKYFSNLIANRPKVLFKTINSVLSPIVCSVPDVNIETCTQFSEFFVQKIQDIRSHLSPFDLDHSHLVH